MVMVMMVMMVMIMMELLDTHKVYSVHHNDTTYCKKGVSLAGTTCTF